MKKISGYIEDELYEAIILLAEKEKRKFAPMVSILLQVAVKEKTRKRKNDKKDNS